jgi:tRNA (cmo5U34)-methyltransferase
MPDIAEQFTTGGWQFTPEVAEVFPEHVRASVPFYDAIQDLIAEASDWLVPPNGHVADLGASTGITCCRIAERHPEREIRFDLYDDQPAMLKYAQEALHALSGGQRCLFHTARIQDALTHVGADLTLILFTLQFLSAQDRITALRNAREHAAGTGALIVAEKIRPLDSRWAEIGNDVSHDWKAACGISDAAIRAKARALRGVLNPSPQNSLTAMIKTAGWKSPEVLFRWHQWAVIGAFATVDSNGQASRLRAREGC